VARTPHDRLAVLGGFVKVPASAAQGADVAAFRLCQAIARTGRYPVIDVFHDDAEGRRRDVVLPAGLDSRLLERVELSRSPGRYSAIYAVSTEQHRYPPHSMRPPRDLAPLICEIGTAHSPQQWTNFFLGAWDGSIRETDGFVFKAHFAERAFRQVWERWSQSLGPLAFPLSQVIPNGVDLEANRTDARLRAETRQRLGMGPDEVAFLTFSRLGPGTKGDYRALLFLWKRLIERCPRAVLILSGKNSAPGYLMHLRAMARQAGLGNSILMAEDPYAYWPDARERLMSAADVFVHLSTGAEEVSSNATLEAMAFGLPVIGSAWAGLPELIEDGRNGFLVPTHVSEPPPALQRTMLGRQPSATNSELGRCVGCDGEAFVRAAALLCEDSSTRQDLGRASRRRAETAFDLDQVARRRVAFFDEVARQARERGYSGNQRDLVDLRTFLPSMGTRALAPEDLLTIKRADGFAFLRSAPAMVQDEPVLALVELALRTDGPVTAGEVARRVQALSAVDDQAATGPTPETWRACSRMLVRLASYGVVAIGEAAP
jgi:glycosyltransferase involved in cell wall biosynthesis